MKIGPFESYKFDHVKLRDIGSPLPVVFDIDRGYRRCDCVRAENGKTVFLIGVSNIKADEPTKNYQTQESEEVYALLGIVLNSAKEAEVLGEFFKEISEKMAELKEDDGMADVENVIKAWNCCNPFNRKCKECPYEKDCYHDGISRHMVADAVAMLKSQQAEIERLQPKTVNPVKPMDVDNDFAYLCDSCNGELFCGDVLRDHFCPSCGGRIEWKDGENDG